MADYEKESPMGKKTYYSPISKMATVGMGMKYGYNKMLKDHNQRIKDKETKLSEIKKSLKENLISYDTAISKVKRLKEDLEVAVKNIISRFTDDDRFVTGAGNLVYKQDVLSKAQDLLDNFTAYIEELNAKIAESQLLV